MTPPRSLQRSPDPLAGGEGTCCPLTQKPHPRSRPLGPRYFDTSGYNDFPPNQCVRSWPLCEAPYCRSVAPTPWGTGARAPTFTNGWARGHREWEHSKQKTDQSVLTITKALTKTTNCAFRAEKWRGTTKKHFPALRARSVLPTFAPGRCPHFRIRSGATAAGRSSDRPLVRESTTARLDRTPCWSVAPERIWKLGEVHVLRRKFFWLCPSTFLALQIHLVVSVSAVVMVSTVWSVNCLLFFYSRCPPSLWISVAAEPRIYISGGPRLDSYGALRPCLPSDLPSFTIKITIELTENS